MLLAIRDDEDRARGVGVDVTAAKVIAFAVSVGLTAMIGGIWAYYIAFIYPQFAVDPLVTIGAVLMAFLGGKGTLWGPALGAFILVPVQQYLAYKLGASSSTSSATRPSSWSSCCSSRAASCPRSRTGWPAGARDRRGATSTAPRPRRARSRWRRERRCSRSRASPSASAA